MRTKSTERLKKACEKLRRLWAGFLEAWHDDDPPTHFPDNFPESVSDYWDPACLELADAYLEAKADTLTPWPTITTGDITAVATQFVISHSPAGLEKVLDEAPFRESLLAELDMSQARFRILYEVRMIHPEIEKIYFSTNALEAGGADAHVEFPASERLDSFALSVELRATSSARQACALAVRDILWQAAFLSQAWECCPSADYDGYKCGLKQGWGPSGRTIGREFDREYVSDSTMFLKRPESHEDPEIFVFPNLLQYEATERFAWICCNVLFSKPHKRPDVPASKANLLVVIRDAIWAMAGAARSEGPAAINVYAAVFVKSVEKILELRQVAQGRTAQVIAKAMELSREATQQLDDLLGVRNAATHDLSPKVKGSHVRTMWRLAKCALHYLIAMISDIQRSETRHESEDFRFLVLEVLGDGDEEMSYEYESPQIESALADDVQRILLEQLPPLVYT